MRFLKEENGFWFSRIPHLHLPSTWSSKFDLQTFSVSFASSFTCWSSIEMQTIVNYRINEHFLKLYRNAHKKLFIKILIKPIRSKLIMFLCSTLHSFPNPLQILKNVPSLELSQHCKLEHFWKLHNKKCPSWKHKKTHCALHKIHDARPNLSDQELRNKY